MPEEMNMDEYDWNLGVVYGVPRGEVRFIDGPKHGLIAEKAVEKLEPHPEGGFYVTQFYPDTSEVFSDGKIFRYELQTLNGDHSRDGHWAYVATEYRDMDCADDFVIEAQ